MMQSLKRGSTYIGDNFFDSLRVGLMFSLCMQAKWHLKKRWIKACKRAHVALVDLGPLDPNQPHVTNSQPSISLVKSDSCNLILHLANFGVTRGCL